MAMGTASQPPVSSQASAKVSHPMTATCQHSLPRKTSYSTEIRAPDSILIVPLHPRRLPLFQMLHTRPFRRRDRTPGCPPGPAFHQQRQSNLNTPRQPGLNAHIQSLKRTTDVHTAHSPFLPNGNSSKPSFRANLPLLHPSAYPTHAAATSKPTRNPSSALS